MKAQHLRIGTGSKPALGSINLDVRSRQACGVGDRYVWVIGDGRKLPFQDKSFGSIVARHVVEHVSWRETPFLLEEWLRVLDIGGEIEVVCPNVESYSRRILEASGKPNQQQRLIHLMWGSQDYEWNFHHYGFTPAGLGLMMQRARFDVIDIGVLPLYTIKDAQCKVIARRRR